MTQDNHFTGLHARVQYFQLITALVCEPEEEFVHNDELYVQLQQCVETIHPGLNDQVQMLRDSSQQNLTTLLVEYARLFIGPFKLVAPPYASCYLGSKELNNEITEWVRAFYETSGLEFDYTVMELPDHIAVETEFLHFLLTQQLIAAKENEPEALADFQNRYHTFLEKHHGLWVPVFSQTVIDETGEPFYQNLFRLIRAMLPVL